MKLKFFLILFFLSLLSCSKKLLIIKDLKVLPQNTFYYIKNLPDNSSLISEKYQKFLSNYYIYRFVKPFTQFYPEFKRHFVKWGLRKIKIRSYYFANNKKVSKSFIKKIEKNCNFKSYPNFLKRAITIRNTYLRVLPVDVPIFSKKGNFPFDLMQNSSLYIGTPLFISHISKDKQWVFVENYIAAGWIKVNDIAYVDDNFIEKWFSKKYVCPVIDRVPVYDNYNNFSFIAYIGSQFPLSVEYKNYYTIKIPVKMKNGYASIKKVKVSKKKFIIKPLELTYKNIAFIANQFIGQPYFWGGLYFYRDCSMTLRDIFSVFNIYLPRNSFDQINFKLFGKFYNISKYSPEKKEKFILKRAKPYLTLLWFPGHIMLYIGNYNNKAIILHNFWSIKLKNRKKLIIGETSITTLFPGKELKRVLRKYDYRLKLKAMRILVNIK